jgi:hypothetical protein
LLLNKPFEKFERRQFLGYDRDLAYLRFVPRLWRQWQADDLDQVRDVCRQKPEAYYERIRVR